MGHPKASASQALAWPLSRAARARSEPRELKALWEALEALSPSPLGTHSVRCGSEFNGRGYAGVLVHVSTCLGAGVLSHSHFLGLACFPRGHKCTKALWVPFFRRNTWSFRLSTSLTADALTAFSKWIPGPCLQTGCGEAFSKPSRFSRIFFAPCVCEEPGVVAHSLTGSLTYSLTH